MIARTSRVVLPAALLAFVCVATLGGRRTDAAPKPLPVPVRPVVVFNESYSSNPDTDAGRFVADARIPLDPADVATFDGDTYFDVSIGYFDFDGSLSDDPFWQPGDTTATFTDIGWDGDTQLVLRLRWTPTQLTVHAVAVTGDDIDPIASDDYAYDDSGAIDDATDAEIQFGNADVWWDTVPCAGRVRTWTAKGDDFSVVRTHGRATQ